MRTIPSHFDLRQWAEQSALISGDAILLTLIGADGYTKSTTLNQNGPPPYLGDRPHVVKALQATDDELLISDPVVGRTTKRMSLVLLRRLRNPDGSTAGLITLSITPDFIERFYRSANLGAHGTISIRNRNNVVLAAEGFARDVIGRTVPRGKAMEGNPEAAWPLLGPRRPRPRRPPRRLPHLGQISPLFHGRPVRQSRS